MLSQLSDELVDLREDLILAWKALREGDIYFVDKVEEIERTLQRIEYQVKQIKRLDRIEKKITRLSKEIE